MLRVHFKKKLHGVTLKSGHIYTFDYKAWEHDPKPVIIFMYAFSGNYPTGKRREWRFIQAINFTYIPRAFRRLFATIWISKVGNMSVFKRGGELRFTWNNDVVRLYPYLKPAIRRYFYDPNDYIRNLKEIPYNEWENAIVSTMSRDFSKKVKSALINKYRHAVKGFKNIFGRRI